MPRCPLLAVLALGAPLLAQQNDALFDAPVVQLPDDSPPMQKLFDYDGDGDMDAVGVRVRSDGAYAEVRVWRNDQGRFVQAFNDNRWTGNGGISGVAVGDFDQDGDPDFVYGTGTNCYHFTNNAGTWSYTTTTATTDRVSDLAAGDFDGDGACDLATLLWPNVYTSLRVSIKFANGAQVTAPAAVTTPLGSRLEVLDLNGNPADELGITYITYNQMQRLECIGQTISWLPSLSVPPASVQYLHWTSGDVDGDGDTDVVAFELAQSSTPARVHCLRRTGATTFVTEAAYAGGPAEFLADADGDGDLDGVCCGGGGGGTPTWPRVDFGSVFEIAINDGTGRLAPAFGMAGKGSIRLAGVADVDLDGDPDLVAGACVYYGRGTLNPSLSPQAGYLDPNQLFRVAWTAEQVGDFDGDGDPDYPSSLTRQGRNDGTGFHQLGDTAMAALLPAGHTTGLPRFRGDFDGDGAIDYVTPLFSAGGTFSHMGLIRNNGSGKLSYAGPAAAAGQQIGWQIPWYATTLTSTLVHDLDGDGDLDLVARSDAAYELTYRCELWWNNGQGTFIAGPTYGTERIEVAADFDGNGRTDVLCRQTSGGMVMRLGTGIAAAPFGPPLLVLPTLAYDTNPGTFAVVDANDDGRPDLITRHYANSLWTRNLYCNMTTVPGSPVLQASGVLPIGENYDLGSVVTADIDGDGRSDLLYMSPANATFATRIWRRLSGTGALLLPSHYAPPVTQVIWDGFPADADADGDLDLIGNFVARNLRRHGAAAGRRLQYGTGGAGEAGIVPLLGCGPTVRAGEVSELKLRGVTGPSMALLAIAFAPASFANVPVPGVTLLVDPTSAITALWPIPADGGGQARASASLPFWLAPGLQGFAFFDQVFVLDPAAPGGISASNGLQTTIGG